MDGLLYAAARELVGNVVKHARATSAMVILSHAHGSAGLVVSDDGRGIDDHAAERSLGEGHIGLASYRARIEAAGGTLSLTAADGVGTTVRIELPCTAHGVPEP